MKLMNLSSSSSIVLAHLAAQEGHLPCLKFLVSNGATISDTLGARNDNGDTPKTLASQYYKQHCVDYINAVGNTVFPVYKELSRRQEIWSLKADGLCRQVQQHVILFQRNKKWSS